MRPHHALLVAFVAACAAPRTSRGPPAAPPRDTIPTAPADTLPEPPVVPPESLPSPLVAAPQPEPSTPQVDTVRLGERRPMRICVGGDVMLGSDLDTSWTREASLRWGRPMPGLPDPNQLLAPLRPLLVDADVVMLNAEGAIGEGPVPAKCRSGSTNCYAFRQPPAVAEALRRLAPHAAIVANVANNHAMDAGGDGFAETMRWLRAAGVHVTGADTNPTLVALDGDTLAILGFSPFQAGPDPRDLELVARLVARAAQRYSRLIVTMHMGAEGATAQRTPDADEMFLGEHRGNEVAFARTAIREGASAAFGHGPHVMRAAEWWDGGFVIYSLGNLVTYGPFNLSEPRNHGGFACITLDSTGRVERAALRSTLQAVPGLVRPDPAGRAAWLVDSLSALDFPSTRVRLVSEGWLQPADSVP